MKKNSTSTLRRLVIRLLLALPAVLPFILPGTAGAARWPDRPIKILVGFSAGGGADAIARMLGESMSKSLGQSVIVENRPGAGTTLAAGALAKSTPDGYTLMLMSSSNAISPGMYKSLSYDAAKDFTMIGTVARGPIIIAVSKGSGITTLPQLIALARKEPGKLNYGAGGIGTTAHLAALVLQKDAGIQMTHIPYKGGNETAVALLGGQIEVQFGTPPSVTAIAAKANLLAVTSANRSPMTPGVPAVAETIKGYGVEAWYALAAPAGIPAPARQRLAEALSVALGEKKLKDQLNLQGVDAAPASPSDSQALYLDELRRWGEVVREEGLKMED